MTPPTESSRTHYPSLIDLKQGSRYLNLFNQLSKSSSLELSNVDENVFVFLDSTEIHVFRRVWQKLRMSVIPGWIVSIGCEDRVGLVMRTSHPHPSTGECHISSSS